MALGAKTGGRQKGTPNKISATVKENVVRVFDEIGGVERMVAWAVENQTEFYRLYSKLLPTEATVNIAHDPREMTTDELVAAILKERTDKPSGGKKQPSSVH